MLQVGVKAPGTANSTTLRPAKIVSVATFWVPSAVIIRKSDCGSLSPILMVMISFPVCEAMHLGDDDILFKREVAADHRQLERSSREPQRIGGARQRQHAGVAALELRRVKIARILALDENIEILRQLSSKSEPEPELTAGNIGVCRDDAQRG